MKLYKRLENYITKADRYAILRGALLLFVFASLLTYGVLYTSHEQNKNAALETLMESASQSAAKITSEMRLASDRVSAVASSVGAFDSFDDEKMLGILKTSPDDAMFSHMAIRLFDGSSLQSNGKVENSVEWTRETASFSAGDEVTVGSRTKSAQDGQDIFRIFAPIHGRLTQKEPAWVYGVITTASLSHRLNSTGFGGQSSLVVFEKHSGHVLMNTDNTLDLGGADIGGLSKLTYGKGYSANKVFKDIVASRKGNTQFATEDGAMLCAYVPVGVSDWYLLQLVHEEVLFGSLEKERRSMIANFFIVLGVMFIFVLWTNGRVAKVKKDDESSKYHAGMRNRVLATALSDTSIRVFMYYKNTDTVVFLKNGAQTVDENAPVSNGLEKITEYEAFSADDARKLKNNVALVGVGKTVKFTLCSHAGNKEAYLRYTLAGAKDENGDPTIVIGTARDITEDENYRRKQIDLEKFRNSVVTYKTTGFEISLERNRWRIMWINEPAIENSGFEVSRESYNYDADLEKYILPQLHPSDRAQFATFLNRLTLLEDFRRGKTEKTFDYRIKSDKADSYEYRVIEVHLLRDKLTDEAKADIYVRNIENADLERFTVKQLDEITTHILSSVLGFIGGDCIRAAYAQLDEGVVLPVSFNGKDFLPKLEKFDFEGFMKDYANNYVHEDYRQEFIQKSSLEYIKEALKSSDCTTVDFETHRTADGKEELVSATRFIYKAGSSGNEAVIIERPSQRA